MVSSDNGAEEGLTIMAVDSIGVEDIKGDDDAE
jgi:hypothetical protein